jgi:hypothetical protein
MFVLTSLNFVSLRNNLLKDAEDVVLMHDQVLDIIDLDLVAGVFAVQDAVSRLGY